MREWTPQEIRAFRKSLGLSQVDFGKMLGVSGRWVSILEGGDDNPGMTLRLLLDCLEGKKAKRKEVKKSGKGTKRTV